MPEKFDMIQTIWKSGVILGSVILTAFVSPTGSFPVAEAQNSYPEEFVTQYLQGCNARSQQEGLTPRQAQVLCQCTIDEYQARFSIEEFAAIVRQLQDTGEAPDELLEVSLTCSAQLRGN